MHHARPSSSLRRTRLVIAIATSLAVSGCSDPGPCATARHDDGSYTLALDGLCLDGVTVDHRVDGAWQAGGTELQWRAAAPGGLEVTLVADAPAQALELAIPALDVDQMFQQGYQSWSFSGTVEIPLMVPLDDDGRARMTAARTGSAIDEARGVSFETALFRKGDTGRVLVVAALSAARAVTGIAATRDVGGPPRLSIIYGPQRELLAPETGDGHAHSEVLYLATADTPEAALAQVSTELVAAHASDGFTPQRPPGGWFSWNSMFTAVDAASVRGELDLAQSALLPAGLPLVEIDDGWEVAWGDWRDNPKFPDGLPALAADIRARGLTAGVWLAPFLVDVTSQTATADPALFVRGADGNPLVHKSPGVTGSYYVLDGSNPASMALVTDQIHRLATGGFTFFKLDFLYAGALAGQRARGVTGIEALRAGLALVREAAGPDAILNACGSPTLPVLGIVDSLRVGPDTAFAGVDINFIMVASAARNLAARAHLWPLVWPDADQAQLRAPLTLDEARTSAVTAALASAAYGLGDDLVQLDPDRLAIALDPVILDLSLAPAPATPDGFMTMPTGAIALSPLLENGLVTPPAATFHTTGASGTAYTITVDWTGTHAVTIAP
ncbi:MAG TPA: glycoside hydrolase family 36 protein [Kofleriaceae bacterium]|nr:glycoside hydrolase family 36 protein [Kofleriaceae bacterium]